MTDIIERVEKAVDRYRYDSDPDHASVHWVWDSEAPRGSPVLHTVSTHAEARQICRKLNALAVLAAMRYPTGNMILAGGEPGVHERGEGGIWMAMIDEALK